MKQLNLNSKIITKPLAVTSNDQIPSNNRRSEVNGTDQLSITDCHHLSSNNIKSRVDYLTIQYKPSNKQEFELLLHNVTQFLSYIGIKSIQSKPDVRYFDDGMLLQANDETKKYCGSFKWRNCYSVLQLELSGNGCSYVNTSEYYFLPLVSISKTIRTEIRRIDIAVDSFSKTHGLRFAQQAYSRGDFSPSSGIKPKKRVYSTPSGKSVVIGSRHSNKQIICYEKGRQLGFSKETDEYKLWVRFEVKLRSRQGATIPLDAILQPDEFFVGAYPKANRKLITGVQPRSIKREVLKTVDKNLTQKLQYARHQVGKTIYRASTRGLSDEIIVSKIIRRTSKDKLAYPSFISEEDKKNYPFD
ncbi:hypothetical protein C2869_19550 [Saccharobesus litoralis]|uniref:Replication initiation protein-like C-terminal domain-containing protein n=1 Tax=Saccharobesus litoralis TaxID=2172099 RepID=A0A2S0VWB2_9ALTE|nr:replication initiation factor domain-containing protein [Saccharobesus litoralis]AWB68463.1 hypothetical protein C2869_19550 [Saccharobesus litoralis]